MTTNEDTKDQFDETQRELDSYLELERKRPWYSKARENVNDLASAHWFIALIVFGGALISVLWGACLAMKGRY